jgi:hypothetical protein
VSDPRRTLDDAYVELSRETGASVLNLREAALELAGHDNSSDFGTEREEAAALAALATGLRDGTLAARQLSEGYAQAEHERIAAAYGREAWDSDNGLPRFDSRKLAAGDYAPQELPPGPVPDRQPARLTPDQASEVDRLLPLSQSLQRGEPMRPRYGSATGGPAASERMFTAPGAPRAPVSDEVILAHALADTDPGAVALARSSYHGGAGQHEVTSANRAHVEDREGYAGDPSRDVAADVARLEREYPEYFGGRNGRRPGGKVTDPTRGELAAPGSQGSQSVRPKSESQRSAGTHRSRPGHTGGWWR